MIIIKIVMLLTISILVSWLMVFYSLSKIVKYNLNIDTPIHLIRYLLMKPFGNNYLGDIIAYSDEESIVYLFNQLQNQLIYRKYAHLSDLYYFAKYHKSWKVRDAAIEAIIANAPDEDITKYNKLIEKEISMEDISKAREEYLSMLKV